MRIIDGDMCDITRLFKKNHTKILKSVDFSCASAIIKMSFDSIIYHKEKRIPNQRNALLAFYSVLAISLRYDANSSRRSSLLSANSTVAERKPCLLPMS